ncbi:FAD/NAD(P)-binding domain-containing protein [Mytilinidion resinicola]|uniref:FAD/NAD(P)-binding domain-containing protein n=1 Tax=Mytilinidion resinicola TaxID=574789 RepID=A0A6A6XZD5_9PEZI|nr:FAD/NAD(P)-binding domain-containing protein [Mytilinidion resinicola]KAF2801936.1 FAD/NAD(P)-binding domain-containing protein [Mytilinidion resinicola]
MSLKHFDACVIGSGQSGTPLASALAGSGRRTCLIERTHVGGCCVNEGCTPTKTMVASGRVAYWARRAGEERKRDIVKSFREGGEKRLQAAGVEVLMGEASFVGPKELVVKMEGGGEKVSADLIFINTGERPSRPNLDGLESIDPARVLDSTSIQELEEAPQHLIVLGGGYIGLEFGQLWRRFGSKVTIIQRGPQLLPREDPEIASCILSILQEDGIDVLLNTSPISITTTPSNPISLTLKPPTGNPSTISGTHLLLATGRTPNTTSLNLPLAAIRTSPRGHIIVSPTLETSAPGTYALGDVHGPPAFTHVSYDDFRIIRDNLLATPEPSPSALHTTAARAATIPYVCYTDPQVAHVGLHLAEARKLSPPRKLRTASMPGTWIARALETDETRGMLKAVVDGETGKILGFSAVGPEAGEVMAVVQMAMVGGVGWEGLREMVFAHPSWAESLNNLWGVLREDDGK